MAEFSSEWNTTTSTLTTRLGGIATFEDVTAWIASLSAAVSAIPDNTPFKLLVDLSHYQFANLDAHKEMRVVIPILLSQCNFKSWLVTHFSGAEIDISSVRGLRCVAVAHVHDDEGKMREYETRAQSPVERFFSNVDDAKTWLESAAEGRIKGH